MSTEKENGRILGLSRSDLDILQGTIVPVLVYCQKSSNGALYQIEEPYRVEVPLVGNPGKEITYLEHFRFNKGLMVPTKIFIAGGLSHDGQFGFYGVRDEIRMRRLLESGS